MAVVLLALLLTAVLLVVLGGAVGDASRSLVAEFRDSPSADERAAADVEDLAAELETWLERRPYTPRTGPDLARAAVARHETAGPDVVALEAAGEGRRGTTEFVLRIRIDSEYQMGWKGGRRWAPLSAVSASPRAITSRTSDTSPSRAATVLRSISPQEPAALQAAANRRCPVASQAAHAIDDLGRA